MFLMNSCGFATGMCDSRWCQFFATRLLVTIQPLGSTPDVVETRCLAVHLKTTWDDDPNWRFFQWDHEPVFFPTRTIRWWHDCGRDPFYEDFSTKVWILKAKSRKNICWAEVRCTRSAFRQQRAVKRNCRCHVAPGRNRRKTGIHRIHSKIRISPTRTDRFHQQIRIWIGASAMILSATRFWLLIPPWKWSKWSLHVCVFYPLQNHGFWVHRLMWFPWKMKWVCHGPMNQLINLQYVLDFVPSMGTPAVPANSVGRSFSSSHGRVLQGVPESCCLSSAKQVR